MKQMQIYVSMPSFNITESKGWRRTRSQRDAVCVRVCYWVPAGAHILACVYVSACAILALDFLCFCLRSCFSEMLLCCDEEESYKKRRERQWGEAIILLREASVS